MRLEPKLRAFLERAVSVGIIPDLGSDLPSPSLTPLQVQALVGMRMHLTTVQTYGPDCPFSMLTFDTFREGFFFLSIRVGCFPFFYQGWI